MLPLPTTERFPPRRLTSPLPAAGRAATRGKHVPKSVGLAILAVATPLIIWDASRTSDALDELDRDAHASRYEVCRDKSHELGLPLHKAQPFCRCVTNEAKKRGAERVYGSYDDAPITDITRMRAAANGFRFG